MIATASDDKTLKIWDFTRSNAAANGNDNDNDNVNVNDNVNDDDNDNTIGMPSVGTGSSDNSTGDAITDALVEFKGHSNFCFFVEFNLQGNLLVSGLLFHPPKYHLHKTSFSSIFF